MLLSIIQDNRNKIILDLSGLKAINASGMPYGEFSALGVTPDEDDRFNKYTWKANNIKYPDTVTIKLVENGIPTEPNNISEITLSELQKNIDTLFKELDETQKKVEEKIDSNAVASKTNLTKVRVLKNGITIFAFKGEHTQFDIRWNHKEGCELIVWGYESYENEKESTEHLKEKLDCDDEYIIRFGD